MTEIVKGILTSKLLFTFAVNGNLMVNPKYGIIGFKFLSRHKLSIIRFLSEEFRILVENLKFWENEEFFSHYRIMNNLSQTLFDILNYVSRPNENPSLKEDFFPIEKVYRLGNDHIKVSFGKVENGFFTRDFSFDVNNGEFQINIHLLSRFVMNLTNPLPPRFRAEIVFSKLGISEDNYYFYSPLNKNIPDEIFDLPLINELSEVIVLVDILEEMSKKGIKIPTQEEWFRLLEEDKPLKPLGVLV